jgi:Spy/CpxP family protein refolding chaperone
MTAALLRLLTLLALVLMPIGMTSVPAAASPMPASHHMMTGHCDEQPQQDEAPA